MGCFFGVVFLYKSLDGNHNFHKLSKKKKKWSYYPDQTSWITIFYTLKESELRTLGFELPFAVTEGSRFGRSALDRLALTVDGREINAYSELELRSMDRLALRDHATFLAQRLGAERIGLVPSIDVDLIDYILRAQRLLPGTLASPFTTYSELELRSMDRLRLRDHANLLADRIGSDRTGFVPSLDGDLIDFILRAQRLYPMADSLVRGDPMLRKGPVTVETDRVTGDRVETETFKDAVTGEE